MDTVTLTFEKPNKQIIIEIDEVDLNVAALLTMFEKIALALGSSRKDIQEQMLIRINEICI